MQVVSAALQFHDVEHSLIYGSLLGAINAHDINPREVDNDFVIPHDFVPSPGVIAHLRSRGFVIFKEGIYRVCRLGTGNGKMEKRPPYEIAYFPYTDLYPARYRPVFVEPTFMNTSLTNWNVTLARVRDKWLPVPVREFSRPFLTLKYGKNYRDPDNHKTLDDDTWKQEIRRMEKHKYSTWSRRRQQRGALQ